ncbi:MAG: high-affinity iron transporter [Alphaproteobacteria bacterium]|jgi:high-affinity iron transporter
MLTNTVVLFLRDLLPMFIMFAYLSSVHHSFVQGKWQGMLVIGLSLLLSVIALFQYENISDLFEGTGIEWLKISFISLAFCVFVLVYVKSLAPVKNILIGLACLLLLVVHISSFLLYFTIYFANTDLIYELIIGCAIGIGICVSFYFLFSFIVQELWQSKFSSLVLVLWSLFVANQLSLVANYLHQIDLVDFGTASLTNVSGWIDEDSEYGVIVKVLTGFDATPSVLYGLLISIGFIVILGASLSSRILRKTNVNKRSMLGESS